MGELSSLGYMAAKTRLSLFLQWANGNGAAGKYYVYTLHNECFAGCQICIVCASWSRANCFAVTVLPVVVCV